MNSYKLAISTSSGLESVTKSEIKRLGLDDVTCDNFKLFVYGDENIVAKANIFLRTAGRVYIVIGEFDAVDFDSLYDATYSIDWAQYLPKNAKLHITGTSVNSELFAVSSCQAIVNKAIVDKLLKAYSLSSLSESGTKYEIEVSIYKNHVLLLLDTSGAGLNKRGYRDKTGVAPLRETLAAAMVKLSDWDYDKPLIDPFCGSGTLPIEAAMIANNIAPGLNRSFDFEFFDDKFANAKKTAIELAQEKITSRPLKINGYDISYDAIKLAKYHAERAGVGKLVSFNKLDMREVSNKYKGGTIITNPPYGERLLSPKQVYSLYQDFGKMYNRLDSWSLFAITSFEYFEKAFGKRADKNRKLYNAKLMCRLYQYFKRG